MGRAERACGVRHCRGGGGGGGGRLGARRWSAQLAGRRRLDPWPFASHLHILPPHPHPHPPPTPPRSYVRWIEQRLGVHCKWIGVGPGRDAVVEKPLEQYAAAR